MLYFTKKKSYYCLPKKEVATKILNSKHQKYFLGSTKPTHINKGFPSTTFASM